MLMRIAALAVGFTLSLAACRTPPSSEPSMNEIAEQYVRLVLAVGQHDPDYVDAYYGPESWRTEAEAARATLDQVAADAERLLSDLARTVLPEDAQALLVLRKDYLRSQLEALGARVRMLSGERLTFDEESRALYGVVAPTYPESHFEAALDELDRLLPGTGRIGERYEAFRERFVIPADRLDDVFTLAIDECRRRTLPFVGLPSDERFTVEYVTDKPWSGYNWYQGGFQSVIQVNTDLPIHIDRAVDLACHEGYPGHHVYNALLEQHLVRDRDWVEYSVYALFSPQSMIAEGTANYGIDVAFPGDERVTFERDVLFPAAGLDGDTASEFYEVQALVQQLDYAGNEAARRYLDGEIDRAAAVEWLTRYAMASPARAEQRTRFYDRYRSYVINYNLGRDLVKQFVEARAGGGGDDARWREFTALLASPRLPSGLETVSTD